MNVKVIKLFVFFNNFTKTLITNLIKKFFPNNEKRKISEFIII